MTSSSPARKSKTSSEQSPNIEPDAFVSVATEELSLEQGISELLQERLGRLHAKLRLGIEADHEAQVFGQGINYFHPENLRSSHFVIRTCLLLSGLYGRGRRNAAQVEIRRNYIKSARIPKAFDGYRILQLSDLHVEMSEDAIARSSSLLQEIDYDVCVLTGDYRAQAFGPYEAALRGMSEICAKLKQPIYGVLGNHDTVRMLPGLERMGIRMLLNECETINRDDKCIYIAGIDDAHFTVRTTSKRPVPGYLATRSRSCSRTRRKFISRRPMLVLVFCSADIPMAAKSAFRVASRSPLILFSRGTWALALGPVAT